MRSRFLPCLPLLMILGALLAAATPAFADDPFEKAMLSGDYQRAVKIAQNRVRQQPDSSVAAYDLGCALSRSGDLDGSIQWLNKCAELGYSGIRSIRDNDDLEAVRSHPKFEVVRAAVQANVDKRFAAFREVALKAEPIELLPPNHDAEVETPLIIALHGTGGTGESIARIWKPAASEVGAIIIAPDALRTQRGTKGFSWVFRDESEWYVLHIIEEARKRHRIGPVILTGYSQGANIAFMLGQSHPEVFQAVIPIAGHYEKDVAALPANDGARPRWGLIIGERDPWAETYAAATRDFKSVQMDVRCDVVPGLGHGVPKGRKGRALLLDVLRWSLRPTTSATTSPTSDDR